MWVAFFSLNPSLSYSPWISCDLLSYVGFLWFVICVGVGFGSMGGDSLVGGSDAKRWLLRWWGGVWVLFGFGF